jgi:hypothetical protein
MADFQLNVKINGVEQSVKTIGQLEKALAETNAELAMVEQGSKEFKFLQNQASNLDKVIVELNKDTADFNKNIKNVTQSSEQLNKSFTTTTQAASSGINQATTSSQSLRAELRQITQELQNLEPGSARFQELSVRAGQLRDTIGDTSAVVSALAGSTTERLGKALSSTAQIGIAGFQGITAAQALFGSESEAINESLVKLTALLNLSQALETFGGLGDKVTEITAGFKSLFPAAAAAATATGAAAAATGAEGVAATGAAVSTTAFGVALNALPLVAIVTALGLLVAGLINYVAGSDEAAKAEEERKKRLEEEKTAIDSVISSQAKEGASLVTLLQRLKATNAGSKERRDLIKEINTDYGTTLKNLSDEKAFQDQVTKSVEDYITQLKNKVAAQLIEDKIVKILEKRIANERELEKLQKGLNTNTILFNENLNESFDIRDNYLKQDGIVLDNLGGQIDLNRNLQRVNNTRTETEVGNSKKRITELENENKSFDSQIRNLGEESQKYATLLEGAFGKPAKAAKDTNDDLEKLKAAQEEVFESLKKFSGDANAAELELQRRRLARTDDRIDDLEFERDITLSKIIQEYEAQKKSIDLNIKDEAIRAETLKRLEADYQRFIKAENDKTSLAIDIELGARLQKQKEFYEQLIIAEQVLRKEITFGNSNIGDSLDQLDQRIAQIEINRLTREIEGGKLSRKEFESTLKERERLQGIFDARQKQIQDDLVQRELDFQITEIVKYYQSLDKFEIEFNKETGESKVKATDKYLKESAKLNNDAGQTATDEARRVENIINTTAINLNKEAATKKLENDVEYNDKRKDDSEKTDEEIFANRLNLANKLIQIFQNFADAAGEIEATRVQAEEQKLTERNEQFIKSQQSRVDALEAAYQRELEAGNLTEEQRLKRRKQTDDAIAKITTDTNNVIDASNEELAKKQFKRQKALNITNAIISGAQAVMSAIAQFGPPPSPLGIAGIAAAGIITAAQIAAISSQKYNGGSTGVTGITTPSPPDTSTAIPSVSQSPISSTGGFTSFSSGVGQATGASTTPMTGSMTSNSQRVYVVESDITEVQRRVRVTEEGSSFG